MGASEVCMHDAPLHPDRFDDGLFRLGRECGFLPKVPPPDRLPDAFDAVQAVLDDLPVWLDEDQGREGLLGRPDAIAVAVETLPDLVDEVTALDPVVPEDVRLLSAIFRAYAFLASSFLLEPSHRHKEQHGVYGPGRRVLPAQVARPLVAAADALGVHPWLDYHHAYVLANWVQRDPELPPDERMRVDNLRMAVSFSGTPDEAGFVLTHVAIDAHTGPLLGSVADALAAAHAIRRGEDERAPLHAALREHLDTLRTIDATRREMWRVSRWRHYDDFRVFLMGITGNEAIFGDGVVYEGVERFGGVPQRFRGQTGAQDDVVPVADVFAGIAAYYPDNELTRYLLDLRAYRPPVVRRWLAELDRAVAELRFTELLREDATSLALQLGIAEQVHLFRNGHWQFVQKYILANTRYAVATGGTPVTTWIPNQIEATLACMGDLLAALRGREGDLDPADRAEVARIAESFPERVAVLQAQVAELARRDYDARLVYDLNARFAEAPAAT
jgi:indoleamine 2,3-dioxygenase